MNARKTYSTIILRSPNPLGDFVMSLPAAQAIGKHFSESRLIVMTKQAYLPLLKGLDWYDEVLHYDKYENMGVKGFLKAVGDIRKRRCDLAVLFTNSFSSALMMKLSGVGERVGYVRGKRGRLLTGKIEPQRVNGEIKPLPMVDYYGEIPRFLGCDLPGRAPRLMVTEEEMEQGARFLKERGIDPMRPLLGIVPGAGYGGAKMWPPEYFTRAGDTLGRELDALPVIFAETKDARLTAAITDNMSIKPLDMSREKSSLATLKQLMARCSLVLTTDSGPRHVASALGIPVVVVIGSADPIYSTTEQELVAVERVPMDCSPCMLRECPTDHRCMVELRPERIVRSALKLLGRVEINRSDGI